MDGVFKVWRGGYLGSVLVPVLLLASCRSRSGVSVLVIHFYAHSLLLYMGLWVFMRFPNPLPFSEANMEMILFLDFLSSGTDGSGRELWLADWGSLAPPPWLLILTGGAGGLSSHTPLSHIYTHVHLQGQDEMDKFECIQDIQRVCFTLKHWFTSSCFFLNFTMLVKALHVSTKCYWGTAASQVKRSLHYTEQETGEQQIKKNSHRPN